jgi:hypothetical protein
MVFCRSNFSYNVNRVLTRLAFPSSIAGVASLSQDAT